MQKLYFSKIGLFLISILFIYNLTNAQTTYLPINEEEQYLIDRLQTKSHYLGTKALTGSLPLSRKDAMHFIKQLPSTSNNNQNNTLTPTDQALINKFLNVNGEWSEDASGMDGMQRSVRPFLKYFYTTTSHFFHYDDADFFIVANPVLDISIGKENDIAPLTYKNLRGASIRGRIKNRVGFYTFLADNQERTMQYVRDWETQYKSIPGQDYYRRLSNNTFDAFMGRAYIDFNGFNDRLNVTFGYDKHFIGYGNRSLVLSNFSAPTTFLRLRTQLSNTLHYENLLLELTHQFAGLGNDERLPRKYAAIHQLTWSPIPSLELAVFESNTFNNDTRFNIMNVVPIIGFQSIISSLSSNQTSRWGLQFKMIPLNKVQLYGQTIIESFQTLSMNKNINKKWAAQLGIKYFDIVGIPNLDMQLEGNYVSAFMYSGQNNNDNYTHYNQPMAHPMGANFAEGIFILKYAISSRFNIQTTSQVSWKGYDGAADVNNGGNIFNKLPAEFQTLNYEWINGNEKKLGMYHQLNFTYELFPNFSIDLGGLYLHTNNQTDIGVITHQTYQAYGGIRWNIGRNNYIFN